ncbi:MAG: response regulator, partial [Spirochaetaceae bacterium]|nr:response regulator [Spirochaetaceae bacterium]
GLPSRILVVQEDGTSRSALLRLLESLGFAPDTVDSGEEAMELLSGKEPKAPYDIAIIGPERDGNDGSEFLRWIKSGASPALAARGEENGAENGPPAVILVAVYGSGIGREEAYNMGADAYIVEPVIASSLMDAIARIAGLRSRGARLAGSGAVRLGDSHGIAGAHVLLVEDNEINQQIAVELLRLESVTADVAANGLEAVRMIRDSFDRRRYDVVLMDIQMPVMDGYEASREIRSDERFSLLPIIALTADAFTQDRNSAFEAGMNDLITKPIDPEELFAAIATYYRGKPSSSSSEAVGPARTAALGFPPISGIDIEGGLTRVARNAVLYVELLSKFQASQTGAAAAVGAALDCGDTATAERRLHSTRGVCGNIGAKGAMAAASELERRIVKGEAPDRLKEGLKIFTAAIDTDLMSIGAELPGLVEKYMRVFAHDSGPEDAAAALRNFEGLLAASDGAAVDCWQENRASFIGLCPPERFARISQALVGLDLDSALVELRAMASTANGWSEESI